jgi:hypothetical protein
MKKYVLAMVMVALGVPLALADWQTVSEVTAGSKAAATELAVSRTIRTVQIECTEGAVLVNTLCIYEGGAKTEIRVTRRFNTGEKQDIDLGYDRTVTGFRISNQGPGKFKINAK